MRAIEDPGAELTPAELQDLRRLAAFMVPASAEYGVPGANDEAIFADIVRSLGRDRHAVRKALAILREIAGGDFANLDEAKAEAAATALLAREDPVVTALGRAVLQCYYRDDRVMRALGLEPRPPYPKGHVVEQGDWSLLDAVRGRPRMCGATSTARESDVTARPSPAESTPNCARPANEIVDVLIIGAGASGAAVAWSLAETRMKILCLEQGDWVKSTEFPSNGRDWEARRYGDFDISPNRRALDTDYPINDDDSLMKIANFNGVGGGTILFTAHYPRMHPSDFRVRTLDGVADDWPIDYWALEPYFAENDHMTGVAGLAGDPAYPPHQPNMPPVPLGKTGTRYARAMNELGWHWWPSDIAVATTEYDGRGKCINLGHCTPGCAQGAKASVDITYWPQALRARVELRTRCRVREITTNEHGMASGVIYYDPSGVERSQPAEVVILAANGIGTPRLLLNSASARFPDGLANSSGLVGKNLMLHPWPMVFGYVDEELDGDRGPQTVMWSKEFYETDRTRGFVRGYTLQFTRGTGPANEAITSMAAGRLPWGKDHHRIFRALHYHRMLIGVACEDLPEEHNRVTLDSVLKDGHGIPAPKIDYAIGENTRRMMEHGIARASEILVAAGATNISCSRTVLNYPGHLLGTARMGLDPERSVANEWGRCHDVKNLFIVDGSIWVTSGGVNPTSTIQALALYIADNIKKRLATLFD